MSEREREGMKSRESKRKMRWCFLFLPTLFTAFASFLFTTYCYPLNEDEWIFRCICFHFGIQFRHYYLFSKEGRSSVGVERNSCQSKWGKWEPRKTVNDH